MTTELERWRIRPGFLSDNLLENPKIKHPFDSLICVTSQSPIKLANLVYRYASYHKIEGGYDFTQYDENGDKDPKHQAFLWMGDRAMHTAGCKGFVDGYIIAGACCFRYREWKNAPHGFALQWVWFHPYERAKGHLSNTWSFFLNRFKGFYCEGPHSKGMIAFFKKHGIDWTNNYPWIEAPPESGEKEPASEPA